VRLALEKLQQQLKLKELQESAELYASLYEDDKKLQKLTETSMFFNPMELKKSKRSNEIPLYLSSVQS
jgi:hypothetical protein